MNRRFVAYRSWALAAALLLGGLGCSKSDKLNPVTGKVKLNEQALSGALITFHPKGKVDLKFVPPTALTKEDGTFTVMTGDKEGAPAGDYVLTIICSRAPEPDKKSVVTGGMDTVDILKGAYANRETSQLTAVVKQGKNELETIKLK